MELTYDFDLYIANASLKTLTFVTHTSQMAQLSITSGVVGVVDETIELGEISFSPFPVPGGLGLIWATPELVLETGITGLVSAQLEVSASQHALFTAGLSFESGVWSQIGNVEIGFEHDPPQLTGELNTKGFAGPAFNLLVMNVAGQFLNARGFVELAAEIDPNPQWMLYGGLEANGGVRLEIFDRKIADVEFLLLRHRELLAQGNTVEPPDLTLSLSVSPSGPLNREPGQTASYTATVTSGDSPVSGALVQVNDPLCGFSGFMPSTNGSGQASYSCTVPGGTSSGNHTITFGPATKSGFSQSGTQNRTVSVSQAALSLSVTPSGTLSREPGQTASYTATVTSGDSPVSGALVQVNDPLCGFSGFMSSTNGSGQASYSCTVPGGASSNYTITFGPATKSGFSQSGTQNRTVTAAVLPSPQIDSMNPNPVPGSADDQPVLINGSGFQSGAGLKVRVNWPGGQTDLQGPQVTWLSAGQLRILINVGTAAANWTAQVINPDGEPSNVFGFTVTAAVLPSPQIDSMNPNPVPGSADDQPVLINGSGFQSGAGLKVRVNWPGGQTDLQGPQVTWLSAGQLRILINVGTAAANWTAQVINPDGEPSNVFSFSVTSP